MADKSDIEWTDATAQVASGCDPISEGCKFCYSAHLAGTRLKHLPRTEGLTRRTADGRFVFNGTVRFHDDQVEKMLTWRAPKNLGRRPRVFVADRSDLFHDKITDAQRDKVFAAMALRPDVDWLLLTKRSGLMREYLDADDRDYAIGSALGDMLDGPWIWNEGKKFRPAIEALISASLGEPAKDGEYPVDLLPLPNVHVGVSTEDQQRANERIPDLLATPAAVRFISAEPLLSGIDLTNIKLPNGDVLNALTGEIHDRRSGCIVSETSGLDGAIVGGESGSGARLMHPDWPRALHDQCAAAGVPFFFKQWGAWGPVAVEADGTYEYDSEVRLVSPAGHSVDHADIDRCDFPDNSLLMERRGKARAGRLLDGVEHNGFPEVRRG